MGLLNRFLNTKKTSWTVKYERRIDTLLGVAICKITKSHKWVKFLNAEGEVVGTYCLSCWIRKEDEI